MLTQGETIDPEIANYNFQYLSEPQPMEPAKPVPYIKDLTKALSSNINKKRN